MDWSYTTYSKKTNMNTVLQNHQFKWFLSILAWQILNGSRFEDSCNVYYSKQCSTTSAFALKLQEFRAEKMMPSK